MHIFHSLTHIKQHLLVTFCDKTAENGGLSRKVYQERFIKKGLQGRFIKEGL